MFMNVDQQKAKQVYRTAPALFHCRTMIDGGYRLEIEWFDYGHPMGWAEPKHDVRLRLTLDGALLPIGAEHIVHGYRAAWLPKSMSIKRWNELLKHLPWGYSSSPVQPNTVWKDPVAKTLQFSQLNIDDFKSVISSTTLE
jgi:hypothetical protein